jgi:hypothetical protein
MKQAHYANLTNANVFQAQNNFLETFGEDTPTRLTVIIGGGLAVLGGYLFLVMLLGQQVVKGGV